MQLDNATPESTENEADRVIKTGRPIGSTILKPTDETFKQINGLARIQCTQKEAAAVLGVHLNTFRAFLEAHEKAIESWESGHEQGRASLRRHQYKAAEGGNATMQIWLGKQWLGQKDQSETKTTFVSESTDEFLNARAAQLLGKAGVGVDTGGDGSPEEQAETTQHLSVDGTSQA